MKIRRIIEITLPDGSRHWDTLRPITEDQIIAAATCGVVSRIADELSGGSLMARRDTIRFVTVAEAKRQAGKASR